MTLSKEVSSQDATGIKKRLNSVVARLVNAFQHHVNKDVDIGGIVEKYGTAQKTVLFKVPDVNVARLLRVENNQLVGVARSRKPDIVVEIPSRTFINIVKGNVTRTWPDGSRKTEDYGPMDAYREGLLVITSVTDKEGKNGWLSDLTLFGKELFEQVFPLIRKKVEKGLK